jgi:hypothetical protein
MRVYRYITYNGETLNIADWSRKLGVRRGILVNRLNRGWAVEEVFETPVKKYGPGTRIKKINKAIKKLHIQMILKGYFRKENRTKAYKQLKKDYEYFKQHGQMRIAV